MFYLVLSALLLSPDSVMPGATLRTLDNGLRIVIREDHSANLVAIDLWLRAGSGMERANESGAAHFLEHMLFKGTATRKPGEIDAAFEDIGASLGAGTTRDGAHFHSTVPSQYLERSLDVLSDAIQHSSFAPEEIERERAVILDELARGRNDWRKQAVDSLRSALYPDHPYGRPIIGVGDSLRKIDRDAIVGFYNRLYHPNNATIVLVGDITPETADSAVRKAFGSWERHAIPTVDLPAIKVDAPNRPVSMNADGIDAICGLGFRIPSGRDAAMVCAADLITTILADATVGRLNAACKGICRPGDICADYTTVRGPGVLAIYGAASPAKLDLLKKALDSEIAKLSTVQSDELNAAKRRLLGSYLYDLETYGGQARALGLDDVITTYRSAIEYVDAVKKITPADVKAFAAAYMKPATGAQITFLPQAAK